MIVIVAMPATAGVSIGLIFRYSSTKRPLTCPSKTCSTAETGESLRLLSARDQARPCRNTNVHGAVPPRKMKHLFHRKDAREPPTVLARSLRTNAIADQRMGATPTVESEQYDRGSAKSAGMFAGALLSRAFGRV